MKKALLVLLAVLLVAGSVFAQSATETKSEGPDELTYWASLNAAITANSFDELPYWQELMARTNTKVTFQHVAANNNVYDWEKADWWGLPILEYANVGYVCDLPKTQVGKTIQKTDKGYDITLVNRGETLAYQNILKAKNAQGELIPGTFWTDNFFTLLPGETRVIECTLPAGCKEAQIEIEGWNANVE